MHVTAAVFSDAQTGVTRSLAPFVSGDPRLLLGRPQGRPYPAEAWPPLPLPRGSSRGVVVTRVCRYSWLNLHLSFGWSVTAIITESKRHRNLFIDDVKKKTKSGHRRQRGRGTCGADVRFRF